MRPDLPPEMEHGRPAGPIAPARDASVAGRLARTIRAVAVAVFAAMGLVALADMALTVADPARPMQVAHLAVDWLARLGGLLIGIF